MSAWTPVAYIARLGHEQRGATTEKGIARLRRTLVEVTGFLDQTIADPDEEGWIQLLHAYERAGTIAGIRHKYPAESDR